MRLARFAPLFALAVVGVGALVLVLGVLRATAWAPSPQVATHASAKAPVVVTDTAVLAAGHGSVRATARSTLGAVFLGVARASDVTAWLGDVARTEVTADADHPEAAAREVAGATTVTDPRNADIWVAEAGGTPTAVITWPDAPGDWRLVAAVEGRTAAPDLDIVWPAQTRSSNAPALIAVGAVLALAGVLVLGLLRRRPSPAVARTASGGERVRGRRAAPPGTSPSRPVRERAGPGRHATPATGILRPASSGEPSSSGSTSSSSTTTTADTPADGHRFATNGASSAPVTTLTPAYGVNSQGVLDNRVASSRPRLTEPTPVVGDDDEDDADDAPVVRPFRQPPTGRGGA